jgi:SAM-dependent methyltransferase
MADTCRACGSSRLNDLGPCGPYSAHALGAFGPRTPATGRLLRCRDCRLGQRSPCPSEAELREIYRRTPATDMDYSIDDNVGWRTARDLLMRRFRARSDVAVLDVGCHTGAFLALLPASWSRFGTESAEDPVRIAAGRHGVRVIADSLESVGAEHEGRYDAVTLFDVVEHLIEPLDGLRRAARLLKADGVLIVASGDMDAWTWSLLGPDHWYLQSPQHVSVVSRGFFEYVARRECLRLETLRIAHRAGAEPARWRERIDVAYWALRRRGGLLRIPQRLLQSLPGLGYLRHYQVVPWAMRLRDHVIGLFSNATDIRPLA